MNSLIDQKSVTSESLKEWERKLNEREASVASWEGQLKRSEDDLKKRQQLVAEAESSVETRARKVTQREIDADAGFAAKNRATLADLTTAHSALRADYERLQADLEAARLKGIDKLEKWISEERQTRIEALDKELQADRNRHQAKLAAERQAHDEDLANQRSRLEKEQAEAAEAVHKRREQLQELEEALHHRMGELRCKEEELAGERAAIKQSIVEQSQDRVSDLQRHMDVLREDLRQRNDLVISLESRLDASEGLLARFGDDPAEIEQKIKRQMLEIGRLEKELLSRPTAGDKDRLAALLEQERVWASERDRLSRENAKLKADQHRWLTGVADLEQQRELREIAERRLKVLNAEIEKYKAEVDRLRMLYERPEERAARVEAIEQPWRTDFERSKAEAPEEIEWLHGIVNACEESGMRFPERLVHAFHTSLKAAELSPLTVLAGVSGTGKSELPRLYSRFGGLNFLSLAVQPNWDSPQSLFGFFNSIDNRFNATDVLRAMVQAQHEPGHDSYEHGFSDRLLLVLLDEMNLAHVEQYFSDLLSRLEQRRGEKDVTLGIDVGAGMTPYPLKLGRNVLWVGTMNEDETTKALSDKVIDRSNLLYFPRPRKLLSRAELKLAPEVPLLAQTAWIKWQNTDAQLPSEVVDKFRAGLEEINQRLEHVGRALGHRVWQSVEYYIAKHPAVIAAAAKGEADAIKRAMRRAYEDQIVLKVMPKLRGIETTGDSKTRCLDPIRKQLENDSLGLSEDFDIACRVGHGAFIWNSARYLENGE